MTDTLDQVNHSFSESNTQTIGLIDKLFSVTRPEAVYSEPVTVNDYTVITASELWVGMGYGFGVGGNTPDEDSTAGDPADEEVDVEPAFGGGGGGGGFSMGRPVAAISIGPDGVEVEPVVDATKIALAFVTMLGAMFIVFGRMRRLARSLG